jgi:hypothetical protein
MIPILTVVLIYKWSFSQLHDTDTDSCIDLNTAAFPLYILLLGIAVLHYKSPSSPLQFTGTEKRAAL